MSSEQQIERVNPKKVLRRIAECLPESLGPHLRETVFALYAYSNDILLAEDIDAGVIQFETSAAASQLAKFCGLSKSAMRKRLAELEATGMVSSEINETRNKGNVFKVYYSAGIPVDTYTRRGAQGIPVEQPGIPVEARGYTREAGTSVLTGSSVSSLSGSRKQEEERNASLDHFVETPSVRPGEPGPIVPSLVLQIEEDEGHPPVNTAPPAQHKEIPPPDPADYDMDNRFGRSEYKRALLDWQDSQRATGASA